MAHVACGDSVSFDTDYRELLNDRLCARGLDDRLGGYIILEAAKKAKERGGTCGIYAATTVGEELTKHGAARNVHIKYQWEDGCGRTCTDADAIHMAGRGYLQQLCPYLFAICIIRQKCAVWRMCRDVLTCLRNFYVESGLIFA